LALFGRRPPERVVSIVGAGVRKPAQKRLTYSTVVCLLSPVADMAPHTLWSAMGQSTKSLRDSGVHGLAAEH